MRFVPTAVLAAILFGIVAVAFRSSAAGTEPSAAPSSAVFVNNSYYVTAYPVGGGDGAPIVVPTNMANPEGIARDASGRIYSTNSTTNTVAIYPPNSNGNTPPIAVIGGSDTQLADPRGIALDAGGNIYVLNGFGSIEVFPPLGTNTGILNEAPTADIAGSNTLLDYFPTGIAVDPLGNIYVANSAGGPIVPGEGLDVGMLTVFSAGSNGDVPPVAAITGAATGLAYPSGVAVDSDGNIYVANQYTANTSGPLGDDSSITIYSAGSNGNAAPIAIIAGANADLANLSGIALDSSRNLYVTASTTDVGPHVNVYRAGSSGNAFPSAVIMGAPTQLEGPGIAADSAGNVYVSNLRGGTDQLGSITVYPPGSSGDVVPAATITSNLTGLNNASGLALDSVGNIYVANGSDVTGEDGSIAIYPTGSYAAGPPIATIAGENTRLDNPFGIALDPKGDILALNSDKTITVYPAGSVGDVTPRARIDVGSDGHNRPTGIAVDRRHNLYVANYPGAKCRRRCFQTGTANVAVYPASSDGVATPDALISGFHTGLNTPSAIAVDRSGNIYVADDGGRVKCTSCGCFPKGPASVFVYAAGSSGDATPIATIRGSNTGFGWPYGITLDPSGNIYVLNGPKFDFVAGGRGFCVGTGVINGAPILIFAAGSHGDVAPIGFIGAPELFPSGIAIGPAGPSGPDGAFCY
jgi:sugar lactone lactonase YvrE